MNAVLGFESCTILAYSFRQRLEKDLSSASTLRFGSITTVGVDKSCFRYEFGWSIPPSPLERRRPGVSEAIGLCASKRFPGADGSTEDSTILERNIADLITMHVNKVASRERALVLILGPLLSKVVGRLGYRCLKNSITVGFLSWPDVCEAGCSNGIRIEGGWHGPYPSLHDDSNVRTFFYTAAPGGMPVRLDLFAQSFGGSDRARSSAAQSSASLQAVKQVIAADPFRHPADANLQIPADMGLLSMSLRWSDKRLKTAVSRFGPRLHAQADKERINAIEKDGVLGLSRLSLPKAKDRGTASILHRGEVTDPNYDREWLFCQLERETQQFGEEEGIKRFMRGFHGM